MKHFAALKTWHFRARHFNSIASQVAANPSLVFIPFPEPEQRKKKPKDDVLFLLHRWP